MDYSVDRSIEILERTPSVFRSLLEGLSDEWIMEMYGPDSQTGQEYKTMEVKFVRKK